MTSAVNVAQYGSPGNSLGFKNRIINGDMRIDQRNAGASVTPASGGFVTDRWKFSLQQASKLTAQQNAGSVTPPAGFSNYLGITSSSAYSVISSDFFVVQQVVEGLNFADLAWGTSSAQAVTLSFWVRSSLTGTFGGAFQNNGGSWNYTYSYTINSANTWEQKTVTIPGPTSGTWYTNNTAALYMVVCLGAGSSWLAAPGSWGSTFAMGPTGQTSVVGTSGATFYITGVQLEKGTIATPFEYRDYGRELIMCQRYYEKSFDTNTAPASGVSSTDRKPLIAYSSIRASFYGVFKVTKRTGPTLTLYSGAAAGSGAQWAFYNNSLVWTAISATSSNSKNQDFTIDFGVSSVSNSQSYISDGNWTADAEL